MDPNGFKKPIPAVSNISRSIYSKYLERRSGAPHARQGDAPPTATDVSLSARPFFVEAEHHHDRRGTKQKTDQRPLLRLPLSQVHNFFPAESQ